MKHVVIHGAGPAGAAAAIAVSRAGSTATLVERSPFPRHKVCGEFISPEIAQALDSVEMLASFEALRPARITRMQLNFGAREVSARLPEAAYGLSRFVFDDFLFRSATARGSSVVKRSTSPPHIVATGRSGSQPKGRRLFGFKAHFSGPPHDAVELYFFGNCYVGLNCVENGITNVCGLAPEHLLSEIGFEVDALLARSRALALRIAGLRREMKWLNTGPLVFRNNLGQDRSVTYPAGDALSFVDPFTGTGLVSAVLTGSLAGKCAAQDIQAQDYLRECRKLLARPFLVSSLFRALAGRRLAGDLAKWVPAPWLFHLTRPRLAPKKKPVSPGE